MIFHNWVTIYKYQRCVELQYFKQWCSGKFRSSCSEIISEKVKNPTWTSTKESKACTDYYPATTLLSPPELSILAIHNCWDHHGLLQSGGGIERRWDSSSVLFRGNSTVIALCKDCSGAQCIMRTPTMNILYIQVNSGLKIGSSFYSCTLNSRLILGLCSALEHLHLLIYSRAAAFPLLKDTPCQTKLVYANCLCL